MSAQANPPTDTHAGSFTVLDWLGAVWTGFAVLGLLAFPVVAGSFRAMYAEFGDVELPALTHFVTQPWVPPVLAVGPVVLLILGFRTRIGLGRRRFSVVMAFLLSSVLVAVCLWGVYLPLFDLAGAISAE